MGRTPEPRWWAARKGYYAIVGGKRHPLAKGKESKQEAWKVLRRILAGAGEGNAAKADDLDLHALLDLFLDRVDRDKEASTLRWYKGHLDPFARSVGAIRAADLRPKHVDQWVKAAGKGWSDSTKRGAITAVKAATSWATKMGYLSSDPLRGMERPRMGRRRAVAPAEAPKILGLARDRAFGDVLVALFESGCRPGEVYKVEAKDCDLAAGTWTIKGKSTSTTGKMRVVYLTPKLAEIARRLAEANPSGPIFRNSRGNPWTSNAVRCRFRKRRDELGNVQAYGLRHLYGTDALTKLPPAVVAELMGHSDLKMLQEHYGHVDERTETLRRAASEVRPRADGDASGPPGTP